MKVRFVNQNYRLAWNLVDEIAQLILWRNAGRRIVRIADIDQSFARRRQHLRQIMSIGFVERHLYDFRAVNARVIENRFESRIGSD